MNTITCPHCKKTVEIDLAIRHQIEERVLEDERAKHQKDLEQLRKDTESKIAKRLEEEFLLKVKNSESEIAESKEQNKQLREQLLELSKQFRTLQQKDEEREILMEKKLLEERDKIQEQIIKTEREKSNLEKMELQKQLDDTKKSLEEAQRKAQQKSQQLQGEVLELQLEELLKTSFPHDSIEPVQKGVSGADIRHVVKSPRGTYCGTILWESKRTKEWSDKWLSKLKEDLRIQTANIPVIISIELPQEAKSGIGLKDGVWICSHEFIVPLAMLLRKSLLDVGYQKAISANKGEKAELLYSYITSNEFQQQVEILIEVYNDSLLQVNKERITFEKLWKQREIQAKKLLLSTANIIGNMQGAVGNSLPQIKGLELFELDSG